MRKRRPQARQKPQPKIDQLAMANEITQRFSAADPAFADAMARIIDNKGAIDAAAKDAAANGGTLKDQLNAMMKAMATAEKKDQEN